MDTRSTAHASHLFFARRITANLQSITLRTSPGSEGAQLILLLDGSADCPGYKQVDGSALIVLRHDTSQSLRFYAGSEAMVISLTKRALIKIRQYDLDSRGARLLPEHSMHLSLLNHPDLNAPLKLAFESIETEVNQSNSLSKTLLFSWLSIILVSLWRKVGGEQIMITTSQDTQGILRLFRELVEIHYKEHWTILEYAERMEISHDRIYKSCKRELDLSPQQIVHNRLIEESQLALERSTLNVTQISGFLGFSEPTHFSHFFKRHTGLSPRQYRDSRLELVRQRGKANDLSLADWP